MTNFSLLSARKCVSVLALATIFGCGPGDGNSAFEQGRAAYEIHDLAKADKLLTESLEAAPNNVDRLVALTRVKLDLGQLSEARSLISRAALNADGDIDIALLEAQITWHLKDYKTSADGFSAIAENEKLEPSVRAQAWSGLGVVELSQNKYHLARIAFLRAIRLDRHNAAAWYHLGLIYQELGYQEAALEQFEIFVRLEEKASPRVQKVQRSTIPSIKETIARTNAERPGAAKRDSAACSTAIGRAEKCVKKGAFKVARQAYQEALAADALSFPAALGLAQIWEKTDSTRAGQERALSYYRLACSLRPSAVATFLSAGTLAMRLGNATQAVDIYSRAVAASPTSLEALDGLIRALRKVGNRTSVAQAYQLYRTSLSAKRK